MSATSANKPVAPHVSPLEKKIEEYKTFVETRLQPELKQVLDDRDALYEQISKYLQLKNNILMIKEQNLKEMTSMINIGSEFYVQAKVPDTSRIFVNIGLGFHVEFTLDEAIEWIEKKHTLLEQKAEKLSKEAASIKSNIKMIYATMNDMITRAQGRYGQ